MIIGTLCQAELYCALHPRFRQAFDFLATLASEAGDLDPGRYELSGDDSYAVISDSTLRETAAAPLEVHDRYIDIQMVICGTETFGWRPRTECRNARGEFDRQNDILFFEDPPSTYITAAPSQFLVFFPHDAHAPLIGQGTVRKVVVKVRV